MDEVDELIRMIDSKMSSGVSRLSVGFSEDIHTGVKREAYHHGRCDVGSPWAKGTVTNCDAIDTEPVKKPTRIERMAAHISRFAGKEGFHETLRALPYMQEKHRGQYRKPSRFSDERVPYCVHPLIMACHALALGIRDDSLLAAILLHDVVEDTDTKLADLPFSDEVKRLVGLVTFEKKEGMDKEAAKKRYYAAIAAEPKACVLKLLDRCNNVSTMASSFSQEQLGRYMRETEEYILPLCGKLRVAGPEYADLAFAVRYHIVSVLDTIRCCDPQPDRL